MADPVAMLKQTSSTFYLPTMHLTGDLRDAVMGSYLCLRAIDEIEDHPILSRQRRAALLMAVSDLLQSQFDEAAFTTLLGDSTLHPATRDLYAWVTLCPPSIGPRVWEATATMAARMADWLLRDRHVHTRSDLDQFCFAVSGAVGLLLSDIWAWNDGTPTDRMGALAFGRALQSVNIFKDQEEDARNGMTFLPTGWGNLEILDYAIENLHIADNYVNSITIGQARQFCASILAPSWSVVEAALQGTAPTRESLLALAREALLNGTVRDHSGVISPLKSATAEQYQVSGSEEA